MEKKFISVGNILQAVAMIENGGVVDHVGVINKKLICYFEANEKHTSLLIDWMNYELPR